MRFVLILDRGLIGIVASTVGRCLQIQDIGLDSNPERVKALDHCSHKDHLAFEVVTGCPLHCQRLLGRVVDVSDGRVGDLTTVDSLGQSERAGHIPFAHRVDLQCHFSATFHG